ncbi:hypothetical protein [Microcella flavibacter]|uniref:hypothetical protein n=1 Tax=Microcella flavibacter TaxID=1804990 RepID=UPI00145662C2|nr:hypothetical protein [Microcella flavibacter]
MQIRQVRAGAWTARFSPDGSLSHVRAAGVEVLRGLYAVVRDAAWGTVPGRVEITSEVLREDSFEITFNSVHRAGEIEFDWAGRLTGTPDSRIEFQFSGRARSDFLKNRIGLVALHSLNWSGRPVTLLHPDGSTTDTVYPLQVAPHQPFLDLAGVRQRLDSGGVVELRFEGDVFETEDQRNWSDASFKTYSTPLALPFPVPMAPGDRVEQSVVLTMAPATVPSPAAAPPPAGPAVVTVDTSVVRRWPAVGVTVGPDDDIRSVAPQLAAMGAAHLRVDVAADGGVLRGGSRLEEVAATGIPVELAVHVGADPDAGLEALRRTILSTSVRIAAFAILDSTAPATTARALAAARRRLREVLEGVPLLVGTDDNFAELNRNRIVPGEVGADAVLFSLNPQVHDARSTAVMESTEALPAMIDTARGFANGAPVAVGPVTLKPRRNIYRSGAVDRLGRDDDATDPRQESPFAAAWLVATLEALVTAAVDRITLLEATGPRGVIARDASGREARHRTALHSVLTQLSEAVGSMPAAVQPGGAIRALAVRTPHNVRLLIANTTDEQQTARLAGRAGDLRLAPYEVRAIDLGSAEGGRGRPDNDDEGGAA